MLVLIVLIKKLLIINSICLHEDDIEVLIRHYFGLAVSDEELANLRYPAKNFLKRTDISNRRKLNNLNKVLDKLHETDSNTMPIHDIEFIHIH